MKLSALTFLFLLLGTGACSNLKPEPQRPIEYYYPARRQLPPEVTYSRVMWSHLPQPFPAQTRGNVPLLMPNISIDLPNSNLAEAIEAIAQTIGYEGKYPAEAAQKKVSIKTEGSVLEILREIAQQTDVVAGLDNKNRVVYVHMKALLP